MRTIRWGIIGCGDVCEEKSGPAFYQCENSTLQAVMRRTPSKAADFAKRHQAQKYYTVAEELIQDPDIDVVYVATPPESHAELTTKALQAGKHVYVEKPMGMNYEECMQMNQVAKATGQKLWVAYYRRSLSYFNQVKTLLEAGLLGRLLTVRTEFYRPALPTKLEANSWRTQKDISGGGYFYDMAPHTIDIMIYLLGKIVQVNGVSANRGGLYEVEDTVSASFLFDSGIIGSGVWCYVSPHQATRDLIEIVGERGTLCFSTFDFAPIKLILKEDTQTFHIPRPACVQQDMIQSIVNELLGNGKCPSDGLSGVWASWVMDQIFQ